MELESAQKPASEPAKGRGTWIGIVVVVVVMVTLLAAVFGGLFRPPEEEAQPDVTFGSPVSVLLSTFVNVTEVAGPAAIDEFSAKLTVDGEELVTLEPLNGTSGGAVLVFVDVNPEGELSTGDSFVITAPAPGDFEIVLLHHEVHESGNQSWTVQPILVLSPAVVGATSVEIGVSTVLLAPMLADLRAELRYNGTLNATIDPLVDGASSGNLSFTDPSGPGNLTAGDAFTIDLLDPGPYELTLYWRDAEIASESWTI